MRMINEAGLAIVKADEGCRLTAYHDQRGILTIGWGHTGRDVHAGLTITQAHADALLLLDLSSACKTVDGVTHTVPTTDNEFSAMVSLTYNIGSAAFLGSTVLRAHRVGNHAVAARAFERWDKTHIDGRLVDDPPLLRRRKQEEVLYLT